LRKTFIILSFIFIITSVAILEAGRQPKGLLVVQSTPLKLKIPKGWPRPAKNIFINNPLTEEGFQLGRKLFYDGLLSKDGNFACASCHQQFAAFATFEHDLSHGFNNGFTTRNAPALFNIAWMNELQWDGGVNHLELQALGPMTASNEMAESLDTVLLKLQADTSYKRMFRAAFGTSLINSQRLLKALAQFVGSIISSNAKYDKVMRKQETFSPAEANGYLVYKAKCAFCHTEPLFTDNTFRNNGLPVSNYLKDYGRMKITGLKEDSLKFKVPSLRNLSVSYPYMHDGRFYTVGQVLEHYRIGVQSGPTLDTLLKNKIPMSKLEKSDLILFLSTLTDSTLLHDKRLGAPN
jgi:cytochrome c peroxidase